MSSDLNDSQASDLSVDSGPSLGFSVAWYDSPNGQGQVMLSRVSHQYDIGDNQTQDLDITYGHFSGVALFHQESYITTVSLGIGFAQFDAEYGDDVFASAGVAVGTRYNISQQLAFVTEIRSNISLVDEDSDIFCQNAVCSAQFQDTLWFDTSFSIGLAYQF
ncbi:hypothetical protein LP316_06545 [Thalassotalea sp. LPB0316]|nr:hypothetical protein [Thalassotalea sp. LPB0316]QOL26945.1 hypothetical protein LP316_06545 [Thalassotalea sp. LPB0316]